MKISMVSQEKRKRTREHEEHETTSEESFPITLPSSTMLSSVHDKEFPMASQVLWVRNVPGSNIPFEFMDAVLVLGLHYRVTILVPVDKDTGVILGTEVSLKQINPFNPNNTLFNNNYNINSPNTVFKTRKGMIVFTKIFVQEMDDENGFPVSVLDSNSFKTLTMEGMTNNLWDRLQQASQISSVLSITADQRVVQDPEDDYEDANQELIQGKLIERKKIHLTMNRHVFFDGPAIIFQGIPFLKTLPLEDQIILEKEGILDVQIIVNLFVTDLETTSWTRQVLDDKLVFGFQCNYMVSKEWCEEQQVYRILEKTMLNVLREDPVVITLLCIICFFQDRPGLTERDLIREERFFYVKLMDMYFMAKTSQGHWQSVSYQEVWDNIYQVIPLLSEIKKRKITFIKSSTT